MRKLLLLSFLQFAVSACISQTAAGDWSGIATAGGARLRMVFHIKQADKTYSATFDSPDQQAFGLACGAVFMRHDTLHIAIPMIGGVYAGKFNGPDSIAGTLVQNGYVVLLGLHRISPSAAVKPQTPLPPFPYYREETGYENKQQHIHLAGEFTRPKEPGRYPVLLLITGSGPQDRDESIGLHKPFLVIADYLARHGIATLRVDDRQNGGSTGNFRQSTSLDFATDVEAGLDYLATRNDIDPARIGLLGHSEGGMIAALVAAHRRDVSFAVLLAAPVTGGMQTMYYQAVTKPLNNAGLTQPAIDAYGQLYNSMLRIALDSSAARDVPAYSALTYLSWKNRQPDSILRQLVHVPDDEAIQGNINGFSDLKRPWWRETLTHDVAADLSKLTIPVLCLHGERDEQVDPVSSAALERKLFSENGNKKSEVRVVPGVNHLFQHCTQCGSIAEYLALDETFDRTTLEYIGSWITGITR